MKLSQREKQLVWCLINIGVLLLGVKWVLPEVNRYYQTSVEKLQANENQALEAEVLLAREKELPGRLEQYKKELNEEASYYFSKLDSEYMEAWIMGISQKYPINIETLNIEAIRMQDEEGILEVLPIGMTIEGDEQTLRAFLDALLNDNRHVVLESLEMQEASAQIKIAVYRIDKESDLLDQTQFNEPLGKDYLMKPVEEEVVEEEPEQVQEQTPQDLSALEMLLNQLMRPQGDENSSEQATPSDENNTAQSEIDNQNQPEIEGDSNEEAAETATETTKSDTGQVSNP